MFKAAFIISSLIGCSVGAMSLEPQSVSLPQSLKEVPFADALNVVLEVTQVDIEGIEFPYNASIIEYKDAYRLFFRYDTKKERDIACIELDRTFHPDSKGYVQIATHSRHSEDSRVLQMDDELFLIYNDSWGYSNRCMFVAILDPETLQTRRVVRMPNFRLPGVITRGIEKNWSPFIGYDENGYRSLSFEYQINPRLILRLENPHVEQLAVYNPGKMNFLKHENLWPERWGKISGGTPGRLLGGDVCLAFFHSRFREEDVDWYVMGAYTFENKPPFKILSISEAPIIFQGIYEGVTMRKDLRTCYPSGVVFEEREGQKLAHVSCGWNDRAVKIVTFDLENLLKNLRKVK